MGGHGELSEESPTIPIWPGVHETTTKPIERVCQQGNQPAAVTVQCSYFITAVISWIVYCPVPEGACAY